MLKKVKTRLWRLAARWDLSRRIGGSAWRRRRFLILGYHGISSYQEHEWGPLYLSAAMFRRRMELLREHRCAVLPLGEALAAGRKGTLPERTVVLTFDDGFHDFHGVAFPILQEFGYPVTLYLTTYYVEFNRPVFDPMCSYLLWAGRHRELLQWPEVFHAPVPLDDSGRQRAAAVIRRFALERNCSAREKDDLLAQLACRLAVDYQELCRRRVLHLLTPEEASTLAARGVDLEYHTHRHRLYRSRERMFAELEDNRRRIQAYSGREPRHFCYTGGFYLPQHPAYLREYGMASATTCDAGLCAPGADPMVLPRLVDTAALSELEFAAWLTGTAALLPRRRTRASEGQLGDDRADQAGAR